MELLVGTSAFTVLFGILYLIGYIRDTWKEHSHLERIFHGVYALFQITLVIVAFVIIYVIVALTGQFIINSMH